jgi:AraC-like DNA-binding protein
VTLTVRQEDVRSIARLWREIDEVRLETPERRIAHVLDGLCTLLEADDACWISAVRRPEGGYRGWSFERVQQRFPTEARIVIAEQAAAQIGRGEPDVVSRTWADLAGRSRAVRRDDLVPEPLWRQDPYLDGAARILRISDRLQGASAAGTAEVTFVVDRRDRTVPFERRHVDLLYLFVCGFEREVPTLVGETAVAVSGERTRRKLRKLGSSGNGSASLLRGRIVDLLIRNVSDESFTTDELTRELGMSRSSLERFVRVEWGVSPGTLARRLRLEIAAELLVSSAGSISAVALCAGYAGAAQFTRAFRAMYGVSPSEWRTRAHRTD